MKAFKLGLGVLVASLGVILVACGGGASSGSGGLSSSSASSTSSIASSASNSVPSSGTSSSSVSSSASSAATSPSSVADLYALYNASFENSSSLGGWLATGSGTMGTQSGITPISGNKMLVLKAIGDKYEQWIYKPVAGHKYQITAWVYNMGTIGIEDLGSDNVYETATNHGSSWQKISVSYVSTGSPARVYAKFGNGTGKSYFDDFSTPQDISTSADLALPPPAKIMRYASQVIDLFRWKETLPVLSAAEVQTNKLITLDTTNASSLEANKLSTTPEKYFTLVQDADGYAVQFRAYHGGDSTSNSSNPRSELREKMAYPGAQNSSTDMAWSNTDGKTHTMWFKAKVTRLTSVKPSTVVGQIHDSSDDVTVFRFEGIKGKCPSPATVMNCGTPGVLDDTAELYITDGNTTHAYLLDANYKIGTVFTAKMIAHDGVIEYEYNGVKVPYKQTKSVSGNYFKLGNYVQSNPGTAPNELNTAYGEVYVYDYTISHE